MQYDRAGAVEPARLVTINLATLPGFARPGLPDERRIRRIDTYAFDRAVELQHHGAAWHGIAERDEERVARDRYRRERGERCT